MAAFCRRCSRICWQKRRRPRAPIKIWPLDEVPGVFDYPFRFYTGFEKIITHATPFLHQGGSHGKPLEAHSPCSGGGGSANKAIKPKNLGGNLSESSSIPFQGAISPSATRMTSKGRYRPPIKGSLRSFALCATPGRGVGEALPPFGAELTESGIWQHPSNQMALVHQRHLALRGIHSQEAAGRGVNPGGPVAHAELLRTL